MSIRKEHLTKLAQQLVGRLTPFQLGKAAWTASRSLKGMPYGPGWRQQEFIRGFHMAASGVTYVDVREAA